MRTNPASKLAPRMPEFNALSRDKPMVRDCCPYSVANALRHAVGPAPAGTGSRFRITFASAGPQAEIGLTSETPNAR